MATTRAQGDKMRLGSERASRHPRWHPKTDKAVAVLWLLLPLLISGCGIVRSRSSQPENEAQVLLQKYYQCATEHWADREKLQALYEPYVTALKKTSAAQQKPEQPSPQGSQ